MISIEFCGGPADGRRDTTAISCLKPGDSVSVVVETAAARHTYRLPGVWCGQSRLRLRHAQTVASVSPETEEA